MNESNTPQYDYTITPRTDKQGEGWELVLFKDRKMVSTHQHKDHDDALAEATVWLATD